MNSDKDKKMDMDKLTEKIIGCCYTVSNTLGVGYLEKVYENALFHEMKKQGLSVKKQHPFQVTYDGVVVGDYQVDFLVEDEVIVELKAVDTLSNVHFAQTLNYLKASGLHLALLINFGKPRIQIKRVIND